MRLVGNAPPEACGGRGEPGGTRAMGACEPGQGGNAAAISIAFMCAGEPPRLTPAPARPILPSPGPTERASWPEPKRRRRLPKTTNRRAIPSSPAALTPAAPRRYRPQRFEEVVGQDHVVQSLRNALRLNKVTHAYLFSGTRGVGKTSMARI